jgi:hypothetical protein
VTTRPPLRATLPQPFRLGGSGIGFLAGWRSLAGCRSLPGCRSLAAGRGLGLPPCCFRSGGGMRAGYRTRNEPPAGGSFTEKSGGDLLSQGISPQVPSALASLTSVFGMGTGVTSPQ